MTDVDRERTLEGEVHRVGDWYAIHERPSGWRAHEGATLHVWHKHADSSLYVARGNGTQNQTPDELPALLNLLAECSEPDV